MHSLIQDLQFALRMFARRPAYAVTLVLVLALGIGATSAIFTVVDGVLLQPLPFKNSEQVVVISGAEQGMPGDPLEWWGQGKSFSLLAEYQSGGANFSDGARSERVFATVVSASFFPLLGVTPQLGRTFSAEDERPEQYQVVILSHRLWTRVYNQDGNILGHSVILNGKVYAVIGVMPSGFGYPGHTDLWVPRYGHSVGSLDVGSDKQPDLPKWMNLETMLGRLRGGVSRAQARMELKRLLQLESDTFHPGRGSQYLSIGATPLQEVLVRDQREGLLALFGAVSFLLLIGCVNAAHMILARAAARQKEIAVRLCLGASRIRVLRQMLTESTLLAGLGGTAGIILAFWSVKAIQLFGPKDVPRLADVHLNFRAVGFALGTSLLVGVLVGLAPALQSMARDLTLALKAESSRATGALRRRLRGALVVVEVALTLALLMGAGLMIRSLDNLLRTSPGFEPLNVVSMEFALPSATYAPQAQTQAPAPPNSTLSTKPAKDTSAPSSKSVREEKPDNPRVAAFYQRIADELSQLPGVIAVGEVDRLPLGGKGWGGLFMKVGNAEKFGQGMHISGGYFRTMGIPLLAGREYSLADLRGHARVIVISQIMAHQFWPGENPLGKTLRLESYEEKSPREVIGVVGDVKFAGLGENPGPVYYLPAQSLNMTLVVRTATDPRALVEAIRGRMRKIDASIPLFNIRTLNEVLSDSTAGPRLRSQLMGLFAALALLLAVFGLYSVIAYSVACRTHEIGVRMSLGAQPRDILRMITGEGARLAFIGIIFGTVLSLWLNKLIAGLLYGVRPTDPATLVSAAALLAAGTLLASLLPARRASRTDPASALRWE